MKRILRGLLLAGVLTAIFSIGTLAADLPAEAGMYQPTAETNVTITPKKADDTGITAASGYYAGAERFDVKVTGLTAKAWYLLLVVEGDAGTLPTESSIVYIDQATADDEGTVTFRAYPSKLTKGHYSVYVVGAGKAIKLDAPTAQFEYYAPGVTVSGKVTSYNANNVATVQLKQGGAVKYETTVTGTNADFSIANVVSGTYDLVVTKAGHLTYTVKNVTVGEENLDLTTRAGKAYQAIALLAGNMNDDQAINNSDMMQFRAQFGKKGDAITNGNADINGDNSVNNSDMLIFRNSFGKTEQSCTYDYE